MTMPKVVYAFEGEQEKMQAEIARLRAALNKYGDHLYECDLKNGGNCTCGYEFACSTE